MGRLSSSGSKAGGKRVLALDIGGTKIEAGVVDAGGGVLVRQRIETRSGSSDAELFGDVAELIGSVIDRHHSLNEPDGSVGLDALGVGCGGPMALGGATVSPLNIGAWRSFPLRQSLADVLDGALGGAPWIDRTFIDNDAKALALAEGWLGAAVGVADYIGMVVSTGVGGGIVLGGRLLDGAAGNAGHIGHVIVEPVGTPLPGHVPGTLEAEASGTAIAFRTGRPAAEASPDEVERAGRLVGRAVGSVANLLDLKLAVAAGSVALGFGAPFFAAAQAEIDRVAQLDHSLGTRIVPGGLGADGPLIGAGAVAWTGMGRRLLRS